MRDLRTLCPAILIFLLSLFPAELVAQKAETSDGALPNKSEAGSFSIEHKTELERYNPVLVRSPEERLHLKKRRLEIVRIRQAVIDTLPISRRAKRRLLKELQSTPFTEEWSKVLADLEFEDPLETWEY